MHYGYYMLIISGTCVVRLDCYRIFDHVTGIGKNFDFCVQIDGSCLLIFTIANIIKLKSIEIILLGT